MGMSIPIWKTQNFKMRSLRRFRLLSSLFLISTAFTVKSIFGRDKQNKNCSTLHTDMNSIAGKAKQTAEIFHRLLSRVSSTNTIEKYDN